MKIVLLLILILLSINKIILERSKKISQNAGFPIGKSKFKDIKFPKAWRSSYNKIAINSEYSLENLPKDFIKNCELNNYINNYIYTKEPEKIWNIYDFYTRNGFYLKRYCCEKTIIFVFTDKWNIKMNFSLKVNDRYIAPEQNTIFIAGKGDCIESTEFVEENELEYNFILLY